MRRKRLSNNLSSQHVCICNSNSLNFRRLFLLIFFFVSWLSLPESVIWGLNLSNSYDVLKGTVVLSEALGELVPQHWACALWWVHPSLSTGMDTDLSSCSHHCSEFAFLEFRPVLPLCYWGTQEADISWYVIFLFFSCVYLSLGWRGSRNKLVTTGLR